MTRNELLDLIDRLDGYGLVITDYEMMNARIDSQATFINPLDCHDGTCTSHDDIGEQT